MKELSVAKKMLGRQETLCYANRKLKIVHLPGFDGLREHDFSVALSFPPQEVSAYFHLNKTLFEKQEKQK